MGHFRAVLDTNVLLDILIGESRPSFKASARILQAARDGKMELFLTTQSIIDASYIMSRTPGSSASGFDAAVSYLLDSINVESRDYFDLRRALRDRTDDFEDDVLFAYAEAKGGDAIITSDKGFARRRKDGDILFLTPEELVSYSA